MPEPRETRPVIHWYPASQNFERHPEAGAYDELDENEIDLWAAEMKDTGFDPNHPIELAYDGDALKLFDGFNRLRAVKKARCEFAVYKIPKGTDLKKRAAMVNENRRHETPQSLERKRRAAIEARIEKVAELRQEGKSTRAIAEEVGADQSQVRRDLEKLEKSGELIDSPEKVIDKRGRKQPASRELRLCKACKTKERKGQPLPENCVDCKELRKPKVRKGKTPKITAIQHDVPISESDDTIQCPHCHGTGRLKKEERAKNPVFEALAEVTGTDRITNGGLLGMVAATLAKAEPPYTGDEVRSFGAQFWVFCPYAASSKPQRFRPTPKEIEKNIGMVRAAPPPQQAAAKPKSMSERLRELEEQEAKNDGSRF